MKTSQLMNQITFKGFVTLGLTLSSLLLSACGSQITEKSDSSELLDSSVPTPVANKAMAKCSQDVSSSSDLKVKLTAVTSNTGAINQQFVKVQITALPSYFDTDNLEFSFYRKSVNSQGVVSSDNTALRFQLQDTARARAIGPVVDVVSSDEMEADAKNNNVLFESSQKFLTRNPIMLDTKDLTGDYQILLMVIRPKNGGANEVVKSVQLLLPTFVADPNEYSKTKSSFLTSLHPLKDKMGQTWSESQWLAFTDAYCFRN